MTLVLVILAIVWVAVLLPPALRARAEGRPADSISAFRRQLYVLRRARPGAPRGSRRRERPPELMRPSAIPRGPVVWGSSPAVRTNRGSRPLPTALAARARVARGPSAAVSARTRKRRRDVFLALLTAAAATLVLGIIPAFRPMLVVHLLVDVLLAAYVALLIRQRNLAAEREMKVRFLPSPRTVQPALLRRSVN